MEARVVPSACGEGRGAHQRVATQQVDDLLLAVGQHQINIKRLYCNKQAR